jgi:ABC-type transporter Mla maintaining outer membrane lipid asymmetry ATPase subunit MlaF
VNAVLKDSQVAVNQAVSDLQEKRDHWLEEFNRRNEENAIIDEVIYIFK